MQDGKRKMKKKNNIDYKAKADIELTNEDVHNLYDFFYMSQTTQLHKDLKLNKMWKWYSEMLRKLEKICCPELIPNKKIVKQIVKLKKEIKKAKR